ncbi:hypothetical protein JD82_03649 [Prauserella rugosa]|uniref:CopC domain-containing protein n=1 Tax=Prauserella rugosa TaxID=43354 RepID=A0A660CE07_9PSEU|nr:hypothetical protein JD82_03649 [Prauserella rugosa]
MTARQGTIPTGTPSGTVSGGNFSAARRLLAVAGVVLATLLAAAGPASAHNTLIESDPAEGASLDRAPDEVTLTFDQPVQRGAGDGVNQIAVTGPDGGQWQRGQAQVDGTSVTTALHPLGPKGEYVIGYRILSADGHAVTDEIRFTLTQHGPGGDEAPGQPADAENQADSDTDGGGVPVWVWIVAAVALLGVGVTVALRAGSGRS